MKQKKYGTLSELIETIKKAWYYRKCGFMFRECENKTLNETKGAYVLEQVCERCGRKTWRYPTAKELMNQ